MSTLFNAGKSDILCPPTDIYVLRLTDATAPQLVPAFGERDKPEAEQKKEWQTTFTFKIAECEAEPTDEEAEALSELGLQDWNGFEIRQFYRVGKDFNHPKSGIGAMLKALMQVSEIPVGMNIEMSEYYGRRVKATVAPNGSGYPRINSPVAYRTKKAKPKIVQPVEDDEDEDDAEALFA